MADESYDKSIGTDDRSVVAGTKLWAVIIGFVLVLGIAMIIAFSYGSGKRDAGGPNSENTAARPAEP
jgi:hypothetical protein